MSKDKDSKTRKATAGHLALHFEKLDTAKVTGTSSAVLTYQDGDRTRRNILGTVAPAKASSDFGDIDCWGFTPTDTVSRGVKVVAFKKKTAREVKLGVSEALFLALVGAEGVVVVDEPRQPASKPSRIQGAGTAA